MAEFFALEILNCVHMKTDIRIGACDQKPSLLAERFHFASVCILVGMCFLSH